MPTFRVAGPFEIPTAENYHIGSAEATAFWKGDAKAYSDNIGCYIFGIQYGNNIKPWYVGKTNASFGQEAFDADKLRKYNRLEKNNIEKLPAQGTRVMFFVILDGLYAPNAIDEVETYLIEQAYKVNPALLNKKKLPCEYYWEIIGLTNNFGKRSNAVKEMRRMLEFD